MTLDLRFGGWFECWLATDPDPYDELAGVSGTTVALATEPAFDRVIRFHDPVGSRLGADDPPVGVSVSAVLRDDELLSGHPLEGARVDLLDEPLFEGRNGLLFDDGYEPIVPFKIAIAGGGVRIERADEPAPWPAGEVPNRAAVAHRQGGGVDAESGAEVLKEIDVESPEQWFDRRMARLSRELADAAGRPEAEAGLRLRIEMLRPISVVRVAYGFPIGLRNGAGTVDDPDGALSPPVDVGAPWPIEFWMGGWDQDSLVGYVTGLLRLPEHDPD